MSLAQAIGSSAIHTLSRSAPKAKTRTGARRHSDASMQGISRDERPNRPSDAGWRVRLYKDGEYVANRHFRDAAYGSQDNSLNAAKRFRDDQANEHGVRRRQSQDGVLSKIRIAGGVSQAMLATWLHCSTPLIARWERDGGPDAAICLVSAMLAGIVKPSVDTPVPDLVRVRRSLGLRQDEMAEKFDRGYNAYGEWERGKRRIPGWVKVYVDAISKGWDEIGGTLLAEKQTAAEIPDS
ncbi:transcriptional regulator [Ralstonia pseudosolanacearum]|uniref:transcriptional regulator n=1 Tax=Ralstonia pseudosolanacearum TaxID=1310165 RepID=UPI003CF31087